MSWTENQNLTVCLSHWISKREHEAFYLKAGSRTSTRVCPRGLLLLKASSTAEKDPVTQARTPSEKREAWYVLGFTALNKEQCKSTFLLIINDLNEKIFYLKPMETLCWLQRQGCRVRPLLPLTRTNLTSSFKSRPFMSVINLLFKWEVLLTQHEIWEGRREAYREEGHQFPTWPYSNGPKIHLMYGWNSSWDQEQGKAPFLSCYLIVSPFSDFSWVRHCHFQTCKKFHKKTQLFLSEIKLAVLIFIQHCV